MSRRLAYAQLLRFPNVFTALADVGIGLIVGSADGVTWLCLGLASAALYCAGMVGNDYADRHIDACERPERPIPSGRIDASTARKLMTALFTTGVIAVGATAWHTKTPLIAPAFIVVCLVALIVAYNWKLKNTWAGPTTMGGCRFLNVLLGFSTTPLDVVSWPTRLIIAGIVGVYISGVTVLARDEATRSRKSRLVMGTGVVAIALLASVAAPTLSDSEWRGLATPLIAILGGVLAIVVELTWREPSPRNVQRMVKSAILGLIVLDAALATSLAGPVGLLLLLLLVPAIVVGQRVYST